MRLTAGIAERRERINVAAFVGDVQVIVTMKHPVMSGRESLIRLALESPDEVRQSRRDAGVLLFYKAEATRRWVCAIAKRAGDHAFLVTAYPTDAIKEGTRVWPK